VSPESEFVEGVQWSELSGRILPVERNAILDLAVRSAYRLPGNIIEFGVADGSSTRNLRRAMWTEEIVRALRPRKRLYACDSFEGLSEQYENLAPGTFACKPPRLLGVSIVQGYFEDSLTPDLADEVGPVALASLDADLYSSTLCALQWLTPLLRTGSLLLFDEYTGESKSEKRAHVDWLEESGVSTVLLAHLLRDPSGLGSTPDRRSLYQVVTSSPHVPEVLPLTSRGRRLTRALRQLRMKGVA